MTGPRREVTDPATGHAPDLASTPQDNLTPGLTGADMLAALARACRPAPPQRHDCDASACPYWCERDD